MLVIYSCHPFFKFEWWIVMKFYSPSQNTFAIGFDSDSQFFNSEDDATMNGLWCPICKDTIAVCYSFSHPFQAFSFFSSLSFPPLYRRNLQNSRIRNADNLSLMHWQIFPTLFTVDHRSSDCGLILITDLSIPSYPLLFLRSARADFLINTTNNQKVFES